MILTCSCGQTSLTLTGPPILAVDCCCTSCRAAAPRLKVALGPHGETPFVLYRKDCVTLPPPSHLIAHRLTSAATTRRILTTCCHTPLFLEFKGGHWLSLYSALWPTGTAPPAQMRSMVSDLPDATTLPGDIPNARTQNARFIFALLRAWVAMGFRSPKVITTGEFDA
jgi:hypothetical protein